MACHIQPYSTAIIYLVCSPFVSGRIVQHRLLLLERSLSLENAKFGRFEQIRQIGLTYIM